MSAQTIFSFTTVNGERTPPGPVLERIVLERANTWTVCTATVAVVGHSVLRLTLSGGLVAEVDLLDRMRGPVFAQARTPGGLRPVAIDPETGTAVWPCSVPRPRLVSVEVDDESAWPGRSVRSFRGDGPSQEEQAEMISASVSEYEVSAVRDLT